jgi:hypothetical protein
MVLNPETSLSETDSPTTVRTGNPVTFTYKETNTGSDPFSGVTVTGSSCGAATLVGSSDGNTTTLDPGATWTFTCTETLTNTGTTVKTVTDTASVTGTDTTDGYPGPAETAHASVMVLNPETSLSETASPSSVPVGTPVTFTYMETNTGSDALSAVTVTGSFCGAATFTKSSDGVKTVLNPGATWTFTCTKTVTAAVTDNATATGTDTVDGNPAPPEAAAAAVTITHISTTLTEKASAKKVASGTAVTFTYSETNNKDSDPITGVTVVGSLCGPATFVKSSDGVTTVLDPGATWTYTCTTTLTNVGTKTLKVTDKATANGTDQATNKAAPVELAQVSVKVKPATGCGLSVTVSPNPLVETGVSEVHAVVQVEACASFAGDTVNIVSQQLGLSCTSITFGSLQPGAVAGLNSIQVTLDNDGNVTVSLTGIDCAPGTSLVEADLVQSPYLTADTNLIIEPPSVTKPGVVGFPPNEVETGDTPASGTSDVYSVFYVETDPVYAETTVEITSPELFSRCLGGVTWTTNQGTFHGATATATLDNDGNAVFAFTGASCASGTSTVTADVLSGGHTTYTSNYTVLPPMVTPS